MPLVLTIGDGTTEADFTGGNFHLLWGTWSPRVARRRQGALGGPLYEEVDEEMQIAISGSSAADIRSNLQTLRQLLDQAERWENGENVDVVDISYRPQDGTAPVVSAAILGRNHEIITPSDYDALQDGLQLGNQDNPITVRFRRRGAWLQNAEQQSEAAATANNPGLMSVNFSTGGSVAIPAPVKINVTDDLLGSFVTTPVAVLYAHGTNRLKLLEGEDGTGTQWTSETDSDASGGNVGRRTPTSATAQTVTWSSITFDSDMRKAALIINCRNLSSTISYTVRWRLAGSGYPFSQKTVIGTDTQDPQPVFLGVAITPRLSGTANAIQLEITPDGTGAGASHGLEIDTLGVVAVDNEAGGALWVNNISQAFIIDHALLINPTPEVYTNNAIPKPYSGNPYIYNLGDTFNVLVLGNQGAFWRIRESGSPGTLVGLGLVADRRISYLVPE